MRLKMSVVQPCISVVSHATSDVSHPALYLTAKNGQKYLIGRVSEGLQRSMTERKFKTSKFSQIFLTGDNRWPCVSGLPGLLLSFAERGVDVAKLHTAPGNLFERAVMVTNTWNYFKFHKSLQTKPTSDTYSDENMTVRPVSVESSASFVLQMKPTRGRFMVDKAKALGVSQGTLFGKLSNGEAVTLPESGKVVYPHEVMGPSPAPTRVLVLDLPTMEHVRFVLRNKIDELLSNCTDSCNGYDMRAIYFIFQAGVDLASRDVENLVATLATPGTTRIFISHPLTSPDYNTLNDFGHFQATFRSEFPDHFSPLTSIPAKESLPENLVKLGCSIFQQMHTLSIAPKNTSEVNAKKRAKLSQMEYEPQNTDLQQSEAPHVVPTHCLEETEVVTLGTGASAPSKYRNVAGTLVRTPMVGNILFDSGEATYNFMTRLFGTDGTRQILRELRVLYISHMHADHHLGALRILRAWMNVYRSENLNKRLVLAAPGPFIEFVREWSFIDGFEKDFEECLELLDLDSVCIGDRYTSDVHVAASFIDETASKIGLKVITCTAHHNCQHSYNGSISTLDNKFKVSYSGDTKPNRFFARSVGQGSDLLIHEATHENELEQTAYLKGHSTIGGALEIAKLMNAENTILTHISQRYPKLPTIGTDGAKITPHQYACFGFDGMKAYLSQIREIQQMVPKMSELLEQFDDSEVADENI